MEKIKYLILGAGPAGLVFANTLQMLGEKSFLVLEQESVPGGLCRSLEVDGAPLDLGGGHFLDAKSQTALDFIFSFMPKDEWLEFNRISKINLNSRQIDYPLEANLWQLPTEEQISFLESIAQAGCVRDLPVPDNFSDWITWKFGTRIANEYLLPYNRKIWATDLSELGTYWLHKLPFVTFRDTLRSCLERQPTGSIPAHGKFFYPKDYGFGEVWRRMGASLGDRLITSLPVTKIEVDSLLVNDIFKAELIINTIPWPEWLVLASVPSDIAALIASLRYVSINIDYNTENLTTAAHWLYEPNESISHHRILCRNNFCIGSRGHWTETNVNWSGKPLGWRHQNKYAYPLNTIDKPRVMKKLMTWTASKKIIGLGRWGTWHHMNSDTAVEMSILAARNSLDI
jgi:protoporphyrinogen oxidase